MTAPQAVGARPEAGTERLAAIDVGTNSTRLLVAEVAGGRIAAELAREMVITRLGLGVDRSHRLDPAALRRTLGVLAGYTATCERLGVAAIRLVATSATRDAANRDEFLAGARRLGVEPEVLSGEAEAAATWLGATAGLAAGGRRTLVVDIGGGSTELICGSDRPEVLRSLDIGCVRLAERYLAGDPATPAELARLRADVAAHLASLPPALGPGAAACAAELVVGVAGTVTTVTALALGLDAYDPARIHGATVTAGQVAAVAATLAAMTTAERAALPVMAPGRADVIAAGAALLDELCQALQVREVVASEADILDGVVLGLAAARPGPGAAGAGAPGRRRGGPASGAARRRGA